MYWFSVHPFVAFWRRVGARMTVAIHVALIALLATPVFLLRNSVLAVDYGTNPVLMAIAAGLFCIAMALRMRVHRVFGNGLLMGLPELSPERYGHQLVTTGIYAWIRHPRYVQMVLLTLVCALFSNYLAAHVLVAISVLWVALLVPVEEKELRARFGDHYLAYAGRVPRFLPTLRRRNPGGPEAR